MNGYLFRIIGRLREETAPTFYEVEGGAVVQKGCQCLLLLGSRNDSSK